MSEHTPGPWHVEPEGFSHGCYYEPRVLSGDVGYETAIATVRVGFGKDVEAANAALIAAAPELLEIAKGMHSAEQREYGEILPCRDGGTGCHVCAVIAKAEGK